MLEWSSLPPDTRLAMSYLNMLELSSLPPDTRLAKRLLKYVRMVIATS